MSDGSSSMTLAQISSTRLCMARCMTSGMKRSGVSSGLTVPTYRSMKASISRCCTLSATCCLTACIFDLE